MAIPCINGHASVKCEYARTKCVLLLTRFWLLTERAYHPRRDVSACPPQSMARLVAIGSPTSQSTIAGRRAAHDPARNGAFGQ